MRPQQAASIEFKRLKRHFCLSRWEAIGLLEGLWLVDRERKAAGGLSAMSHEDIAACLEWGGDADGLMAGLVATGWVAYGPAGEIIWAGESARPQASTARQAPTGPTVKERTEWFEDFWRAYPVRRKRAKAKCRDKFLRHITDEATFRVLMERLGEDILSEDWTKEGGEYVPAPERWLNMRRWEDEAVDRRPAGDDMLRPAADPGLDTDFDPANPTPNASPEQIARWERGEFD